MSALGGLTVVMGIPGPVGVTLLPGDWLRYRRRPDLTERLQEKCQAAKVANSFDAARSDHPARAGM